MVIDSDRLKEVYGDKSIRGKMRYRDVRIYIIFKSAGAWKVKVRKKSRKTSIQPTVGRITRVIGLIKKQSFKHCPVSNSI